MRKEVSDLAVPESLHACKRHKAAEEGEDEVVAVPVTDETGVWKDVAKST